MSTVSVTLPIPLQRLKVPDAGPDFSFLEASDKAIAAILQPELLAQAAAVAAAKGNIDQIVSAVERLKKLSEVLSGRVSDRKQNLTAGSDAIADAQAFLRAVELRILRSGSGIARTIIDTDAVEVSNTPEAKALISHDDTALLGQ